MRYPNFLQEGGSIGFVAPSFGCAIEPYYSAFKNAIRTFEKKGFRTKPGPNCFIDTGVGISNTPQLCGQELTEGYLSPDSDVLISCGGGELMCEILPHVDWERIREGKPKWFMGYSDNTNFIFLSAVLCDTAAIYGPCAAAFGMEPWHEAIGDAFDILCGKTKMVHNYKLWERESLKSAEAPLLPYHVTEPVRIRSFEGEKLQFSGRLLGGCMDCLVNLLGTEFDHTKEFTEKYKNDGILWFLEACDLNIMSIRRAVWQMKHAGWFSYVKGFLIGRPLCFGEMGFGIDQYRAVTDLLAEYHVPILMDLDIGHLAPMMPIVCGAMAEVIYEDGKFRMTYHYE